MTHRRIAALVGSAVAVALALLAVLLALDVDDWRDALRDGDLQQAVDDPNPEAWDRDAFVPGDAAERLLGLRDDLGFRRAVALFSLTRLEAGALAPDEIRSAREEALEALTEAAADRDEPARAAQAANLGGILAAEVPGGGSSDISPAQTALESFRSSIALDPDSEDAKRNLERLLRALRSNQRAEEPARNEGGFDRSPGGAGLSPPGEGY